MIAAACVDNRMGMMFAERRQSRDREVIRRIIERAAGRTIWMTPYSLPLFDEFPGSGARADEAFWQIAAEDDVCFVENGDLAEHICDVKEIWLYRWNRDYPGDVFFNVNLQNWRRTMSSEFAGYSHAVITEEIYKK